MKFKDINDLSQWGFTDYNDAICFLLDTVTEVYSIEKTTEIIQSWMDDTEHVKGYCRT